MKTVIVSLMLGITAGLLDVLPMALKKVNSLFMLSAFFTFAVIGLLLPSAEWTSRAWLNGILTGGLVFLPQFFLILKVDRTALPQILITLIILSAGLGALGEGIL